MAKAKILLIEDNRAEARVTRERLEGFGYDVLVAAGGTEGIRLLKTEKADLVLLDVVLPDISGHEVCRWLKLNEDTRAVPVIMLTVKTAVADRVDGLHAGADDYLPKPYDDVELNARIYAALRTKALMDELRRKNQELSEMLERVEVMAVTDSLTELFNRRRLMAIVEKEFSRMRRYHSPLSCLMVDIDYFKGINDRFGHQAGDQVLRQVARVIRDSVREVDTTARWGGEEFVVLLPETTRDQARLPARRILERVHASAIDAIGGETVTVSIGVADCADPVVDSGDKLIVASDMAMYEAKRKGRNRIEPE
ncbi:MAG: diguanylate cyclase [Myxococcales bacterium]|nr:diguanylate cyclase [Myxococcales bacterium]